MAAAEQGLPHDLPVPEHDVRCRRIPGRANQRDDMGSFCAATYKRGIGWINIPTSLLAMVDATVGGKTGVDFDSQKNMIGLFADPKAIFLDCSFLETLELT